MNSKKLKELRTRVKLLQVEWLKSLVSPEEAETINIETINSLLPQQTHYNSMITGSYGDEHSCNNLSYMTDKWIMKILKKNPHIKTLGELNEINERRQRLQRNNNLWMNTL